MLLCLGAGAAGKHTYSLSMNWKFVWVNAGTACLETKTIDYQGAPALQTMLTATSNARADKLFKLRDTLVSVTDLAGNPLLFKKNCIEGDDILDEKAVFTKPAAGKWRVQQRRVRRNGEIAKNDTLCTEPVYDMVSLMMITKDMDFSTLPVGQRREVLMVGSKRVFRQALVYGGTVDLELKKGEARRSRVFTIVKPDNAGLDNELLRFYVSDDADRTPLQIDFFLKFGTAKARIVE